MFRTRTALYYIVHAQNQSNVNEDVLIYLQDRFYKDQDSNDYIGRLPDAKREGVKSEISFYSYARH